MDKFKQIVKKYWKRTVFALSGVLVLIIFLASKIINGIDNAIIDSISHGGTPSTNIVIIGIDDKTLDELGPYGYTYRGKVATVINNVMSNPNRKPAAIGLDILFTGESEDTVGDQALVDACSNAGNVITAAEVLTHEVHEDPSDLTSPMIVESYITKAFAALANVTTIATVNTTQDPDGCVRSCILQSDVTGEHIDSLAIAAYKKFCAKNNYDFDASKYAMNNKLMFKYYTKPEQTAKNSGYEYYSFSDIYNGTQVGNLDDSIILIGGYCDGLQDNFYVSVDKSSKMNGVEIHANIIDSLWNESFYSYTPDWVEYVVFSIIILVLFFIMYSMSFKIESICMPATAALFIGLAFIFLAGKIVFPVMSPVIVVLLGYVFIIIFSYFVERAKRQKVASAFKQYISPEIVDSLVKEDEGQKALTSTLGGVKKNVACLFIDIRGFTKMSEQLTPEEVVNILNKYLGMVTEQVFKNNGMLDKYVGDAVMAVYNAPYDLDDFAFKAVNTAVDIIKAGKAIQKEILETTGREINYGIGVNIGDAIIGNIGCEFRMDFTAIGDTVNTAARLEANAQGNQILISEALYEVVKDRFNFNYVGGLMFKNKQNPVICYEVLGVKGEENVTEPKNKQE